MKDEAFEAPFPLGTSLKSTELLSRNRDPNVTKNEHVYAISCLLKVVSDVISCRNVKTTEGYVVVNFEGASSGGFRDIKNSFRDGAGGPR